MNIEKILSNLNETSKIELKLDLSSEKKHHKKWLKTISGFANSNGGTIIWGVDDKTRELKGLKDSIKKSEIITETINDKIKPYPPYQIKIIKYNDMDFIVVDVDSGVNTPYYLWTSGTKEAYIRKGLSTVPVDVLELNNLINSGRNQAWDAQKTDVLFQEVSFENLYKAYKRYAKKELLKEDYEPLDLVTLDGYLTNAGRLFSDEGLDYSQIFCTRWRGLTTVEAIDSKDFSGSLISLLEQAEAFVKTHTKQSWRIEDKLERITTEEYPFKAVREAIINALVHRSYNIIGSEVHIDIYDDRIIIWSPGGMPNRGIIQKLDIYSLNSIRRNKILCSVFNHLGFMERRGSGLKRIYESYDDFSKKPYFESDENSFRVTFPSKMYGLVDNDEQWQSMAVNGSQRQSMAVNGSHATSVEVEKLIFTLIRNNNKITRKGLSEETKLSIRTIDRYIKRLKEMGYIERIGAGKAGFWRILKK